MARSKEVGKKRPFSGKQEQEKISPKDAKKKATKKLAKDRPRTPSPVSSDTPDLEGSTTEVLTEVTKEKKTRQKRKKPMTYAHYILKVLRSVEPDMRINRKAVCVMDSMVMDLFHRLAAEAADMSIHNRKVILKPRDVEAATKLLLTGELCKNAIKEGVKSIRRYEKSISKPRTK